MAEKKVQPKSPQHEGVDLLTKGERLYPRTNTKDVSKKHTKELNKTPHNNKSNKKVAQTVADQEELNAKANTPNDLLPGDDETKSDDATKTDDSEAPKGKTSGSTTSSR